MVKTFFDTETTGLAPGKIAQLAYIQQDEAGNVKCGNYFFEVDYMSPDAERVTGRGIEDYKKLSGGQKFGDKAQEILSVFKDTMLIAHNLPFDENFISTEFWRQNILFKPADRFDTMVYFRNICKWPGGRNGNPYKDPKLIELVRYLSIDEEVIEKYCNKLFGIRAEGFHDAMYDTTAMFVAFQVWRERINNSVGDWVRTFCKEV